jgi:hypothetical protein
MANVNCHLEHWFHPGDGKRYADPKCRLEHWPHPPRSKKVRVKRDTGEVVVSRYQKEWSAEELKKLMDDAFERGLRRGNR